jgi:hypothetical protein
MGKNRLDLFKFESVKNFLILNIYFPVFYLTIEQNPSTIQLSTSE